MLTQEQIALYAPSNAKNLTQADLAAMGSLTMEDFKDLGLAHPNNQSAYLILADRTKEEKKQTYPLSTWKNLFELHKVGQKQFYPLSFKSIFSKQQTGLKSAAVQDLTKQQVKENLKTAATQTLAQVKEGKEKAEHIAGSEGDGLDFDNKIELDKPLSRMSKQELTALYKKLFKEVPEAGLTNAMLKEAIETKL